MLIGSKFNIRHVIEKDLDSLTSLMNDLVIRGEFLPSLMISPQKLRQQYNQNGLSGEDFERLLIVDLDDNIIGTIWHFKSVPYFNAREIGFTLFDSQQRRKGIMSEAVSLLSNYLFNGLSINRLEIRMDTRNIASEKVAIKCGYEKEGVSCGANFVNGQNVDMNLYALLREAWQRNVLTALSKI
ncbi:GNAT family N-acetyltransferase [Aliikangiella maris]|uniref:GNAT family protein n=2 Tax=Aliikangiella maris TaxID=3162458 RepID=A0ABV3MNH2_9GAMM